MRKLIKNSEIVDNPWQVLEKDYSGDLQQEWVLVPKTYYLDNSSSLCTKANVGLWLDSDEGPEELAPLLDEITTIGINFPKFADGRGYSYARILRDRFFFKGDIMAIGDILHDQLFYLQRCGFNTFAIRDDKNAEAAISGLTDFSDSYQAATDQEKQPLYRRRTY